MKTRSEFMYKKRLNTLLILFISVSFVFFCTGCTKNESAELGSINSSMKNKGIGPVRTIEIDTQIDATLAKNGENLFQSKCTTCHEFEKDKVGPSLGKVFNERTPEWIMNMIINPNEMTKEDPVAKELLAKFVAPMPQQNISQENARAILEYIRQNN